MATVRINESGHGYVAHVAGYGTVILTADQCEEQGISSVEEAYEFIRKDLWAKHGLMIERVPSADS